MSLTLLAAQDDSSWTDVVHHWHRDLLAFVHGDLPRLAVILVICLVLIRVVTFFVKRMRHLADKHVADPQRASELRTLAAVLRATAYGIVGFMALLEALQTFGIPIQPLLASAGVVGVGIGLGAQSLFKDMLNGIFILIEGQYNVGDTVSIASVTGTVDDLTLRITKVRDANGTLYFIPNSQVATVANLSRDYTVATLSVTVDATADPDQVVRILRETALGVRNDPRFSGIAQADPDVPGVEAITGRVVTYPVTMRVRVNQKDPVLRELRRRVIQAFEKNGIPLGTDPMNMLVMQHKDPTAPPAQQPLTQQ